MELPADRSTSRVSRAFHPLDLRVRVRWVGFGSLDESSLQRLSAPANAAVKPAAGRVLTTLDLPNFRLRVSWIGLRTLKRPFIAAVVLLILLVAYSAWTRPSDANNIDETFNPEQGLLSDLMSDDINLGTETIRMIHTALDIGQAKDAFDNNLDTLMRGQNKNPFIMDFEFSQPEEIKGFTLDMGRMDFYIRVKVYAPGSSEPVLYQAEYRDQPPIPHVDMDFANGPGQVKRIYIEIEQINAAEEVHVHIREVVFKK